MSADKGQEGEGTWDRSLFSDTVVYFVQRDSKKAIPILEYHTSAVPLCRSLLSLPSVTAINFRYQSEHYWLLCLKLPNLKHD